MCFHVGSKCITNIQLDQKERGITHMRKGITNIFFDTEFTGLYKNAKLISIGLVADITDECVDTQFYAEFTDYDCAEVHDNTWLEENVINNLIVNQKNLSYIDNYHIGRKEDIKIGLNHWLSQFEQVQLISDVCHYDMTLFIDIFGGAFDIPKNVSPVCHDLNQEIAKIKKISEREAFDLSREDLVHDDLKVCGAKHNSLYDAKVMRAVAISLRREVDDMKELAEIKAMLKYGYGSNIAKLISRI